MQITIAALAAAMTVGAPADLDRLAWMTGSWSLEKDGVTTRETWLPPLGGTMAGVTQTDRPGRPVEVEFATISAEPAGLTFIARVKNQPPTAFVLKAGAEGEAVFENLNHDFPQRVIYRRCEADLCARIEGVVRGKLQAVDWRYRRAP